MISHATTEEQHTMIALPPAAESAPPSFYWRSYQPDDLARVALNDGGIIAWDPGLGKTMAAFAFPVLKHSRHTLMTVPAALHQQMIDEGSSKFGVDVRVIDCQETALEFMRQGILPWPGTVHRDPPPEMPAYFITAYNWLGYEGGDEWKEDQVNDLIRQRRLTVASRLLGLEGALCLSGSWKPQGRTPEAILGIEDGTSPAEVKKAWRTAAKLYHPDLHRGDEQAVAMFQLLNAAYQALTGEGHAQFARQLADLEGSPDHGETVASLREIEMGIGEVRNGIRCVFTPTLASLVCNVFDCIVCDEAVRVKSGTAYQAEGVLRMEGRYRLMLTGTPIKNKLPDLFFLASFVTGYSEKPTARWPYGNTLKDRQQFAADFGVMEENQTKNEKSRAAGNNNRYRKQTAQICNVHRLWRILGPVLVRRRKDDVPGCDIVKKTVVPVRVMPGTSQQAVYQDQLLNPPKKASPLASLGAQLQALRQAALFPASSSLSASEEKRWNFTPKSAAILQLATDLLSQGEQLVVFSPFQEFSADLASRFAQAGVPHLNLDGKTNPTKRGKMVKDFKSGQFPVLIAGIASMGEGHSLDNASHLVLPSLSWAYDENSQAIERVHRLTSRKDVTIYVMVTRNTIDERLAALWQEKGDASDLALDGRLVERQRQEIDLGTLLRESVADFDPTAPTMDEAEISANWSARMKPALAEAYAAYRNLRPTPESAAREVSPKTKARKKASAISRPATPANDQPAAAAPSTALIVIPTPSSTERHLRLLPDPPSVPAIPDPVEPAPQLRPLRSIFALPGGNRQTSPAAPSSPVRSALQAFTF